MSCLSGRYNVLSSSSLVSPMTVRRLIDFSSFFVLNARMAASYEGLPSPMNSTGKFLGAFSIALERVARAGRTPRLSEMLNA